MDDAVYGTPEFQWLLEVTNEAFMDVGAKIGVDMNLLITMCVSEPKSAQFAIQWFVQDLIEQTKSRTWVESSDPGIRALQFELGATAMAYIISRSTTGGDPVIPPEMHDLMNTYPLIVEAMNAIDPP